MSFDELQDKIISLKNPTVAGLDPRPDFVPDHIMKKHLAEKGETLQAAADAYVEFNCGLIDALCDVVPAIKPQSAYYELLGYAGVEALKKTADYGRSKGLYVIADVKRNDIGSTATAYSEAYLGSVKIGNSELYPFDFDAATINAYLGSDGILPFMETCIRRDKAIFALVKTSNPSSVELQDLITGDRTLCTAVGDLIARLSRETVGKYGYSRVGAVVGATYPSDLRFLRRRLDTTFFPRSGIRGPGRRRRGRRARF
jgi:orotidine-5'-phosphate decarboxylase